jgi:CRP-like cAMP-binding protein
MSIVDFINKHLHTNINCNADLPFKTYEQHYDENKILTNYEIIETKAYFIKTGIVQIAMPYNDDDERILDFMIEQNFVSAYSSWLTQQPSDVKLTTITKVEVEFFNYKDLQNAYATSLLANQFGRYVTEKLYLNNTKREKDFLTKTAEQRYLELLQKRPNIISLLPVNKIAKYLGIHAESLSRIRKSLIS